MKKSTAVFLASIMLLLCFSPCAFARSYGKYTSNGRQEAIDHIREVYPDGSYFTSDGKKDTNSGDARCQLSNIPARGDLPSGRSVVNATFNECWSCSAFANYVFYIIYGEVYWDLEKASSPVFGDYIKLNNGAHKAIYLWEDDTYYYVFDGNGNSDNGVKYNDTFRKSGWRITEVYHAKNYNKVLASSSPVHREFIGDEYSLQSSFKGHYLGTDGENASFDKKYSAYDPGTVIVQRTKSISFALKEDKNSYLTLSFDEKKNPVLTFEPKTSSLTQKWSCEEIAGGYILRNLSDTGKVLQYDGTKLSYTEYTGAASQMFRITHLSHRYDEKVTREATCLVYGIKEMTCSVCGYAYTVSTGYADHKYTDEKVTAPTSCTYGFTKAACSVCGTVSRYALKEKLVPGSLVETDKIRQLSEGYVYTDGHVTDEELLDTFPNAENYDEKACASGSTLYTYYPYYEGSYTVISAGDTDGNGLTEASDARTALRVSVGLEELDYYWQQKAADIDNDGEISPADARSILRISLKLEKYDFSVLDR